MHACLTVLSALDFQGKNHRPGRIVSSRFAMSGNENPYYGNPFTRQRNRESNAETCFPLCGYRKAGIQAEVLTGRA
jgi:hypothetical protein